jgi:hypothetical protein
LLAREGDEIEVAPGVTRRYRGFSLLTGSGGEDGHATGLNRYGEFVFRNEYWDFNDGIVEVVLPEPTSLFALCLLPLVRGRSARTKVPPEKEKRARE